LGVNIDKPAYRLVLHGGEKPVNSGLLQPDIGLGDIEYPLGPHLLDGDGDHFLSRRGGRQNGLIARSHHASAHILPLKACCRFLLPSLGRLSDEAELGEGYILLPWPAGAVAHGRSSIPAPAMNLQETLDNKGLDPVPRD